MRKLTKSQVIAQVKKNGSLTIEMYPSKCGPTNQVWVRGFSFELFYEDGEIVYRNTDDMGTFESLINAFLYYNCNAELGNRVHYYVEE